MFKKFSLGSNYCACAQLKLYSRVVTLNVFFSKENFLTSFFKDSYKVQSIEENRKKIIQALSEKKANNPCPRCNHEKFTLLDGYFNQSLQPSLQNGLVIGGTTVPSIVIVCNNCGYMFQHALGVLGLIPESENGKE